MCERSIVTILNFLKANLG